MDKRAGDKCAGHGRDMAGTIVQGQRGAGHRDMGQMYRKRGAWRSTSLLCECVAVWCGSFVCAVPYRCQRVVSYRCDSVLQVWKRVVFYRTMFGIIYLYQLVL